MQYDPQIPPAVHQHAFVKLSKEATKGIFLVLNVLAILKDSLDHFVVRSQLQYLLVSEVIVREIPAFFTEAPFLTEMMLDSCGNKILVIDLRFKQANNDSGSKMEHLAYGEPVSILGV